MAVVAMMTSFLMIALDTTLEGGSVVKLGWVYSGGPEGSMSLLSAIASSMVTVAGVTFSITIVSLTLASSQFGPRLLNNFMRDRGNQVVLGIFISTFVYCLLVLRTIRTDDPFVPHISITFGIILALLSFFFLIYFIHHIATSIQAEHVITLVWKDLERMTDLLYPEELGHGQGEADLRKDEAPPGFSAGAMSIECLGTGYVQSVDAEGIMEIAKERDLIFRLEHGPGDFVIKGTCLALVWPGSSASEDLAGALNDKFYLGRQRTPVQDLQFCIEQLVEVAIRALSPGINDTFTAIACIDRLSAGVFRLAGRRIPSPYRYDDNDRLRVIAYPLTFSGYVGSAFNLIRQNANIAVIIRLLESLNTIAGSTENREYLKVLYKHARMVKWEGEKRDIAQEDLADILARYEMVRRTIALRDMEALDDDDLNTQDGRSQTDHSL
jgi:uncharacterized membrane protein